MSRNKKVIKTLISRENNQHLTSAFNYVKPGKLLTLLGTVVSIGCLISLPGLAQFHPKSHPSPIVAAKSPVTTVNSTPIQPEDVSGDYSGQLLFQGKRSSYYLYTPKSYRPDQPMPLVIAFHGSHGSGRSLANATHLNNLAEQQGFIVVYPDGINYHWHEVKGLSCWARIYTNLTEIGKIYLCY